jgi:hypothetical protein
MFWDGFNFSFSDQLLVKDFMYLMLFIEICYYSDLILIIHGGNKNIDLKSTNGQEFIVFIPTQGHIYNSSIFLVEEKYIVFFF